MFVMRASLELAAEAGIDAATQKRAKEYQRRKRFVNWASSILLLIFLLAVYATGLSTTVAEALTNRWGFWGSSISYFAVLFVVTMLLHAPFDYKNDFLIEKEYGFSTQTLQGWLKDLLKGWILNFIILGIAALFTFWALLALPKLWWLVVGLGYVVLVVVLGQLFPVLILPIFYKLKPLENHPLQEKIEQFLQKGGLRAQGVYEMAASEKTTKENAMLAGLGKTKRVILFDTLLRNRTPDEIEVVVAHEVGHSHHQHTWVLIASQALIFLLTIFVLDLVMVRLDPRFAPEGRTLTTILSVLPMMLAVFSALSFLFKPLVLLISRRCERQADTFALDATGKPQALIRFWVDLARKQLSDAYPHPFIKLFYYSHPPLSERIALAKRWAHSKGA